MKRHQFLMIVILAALFPALVIGEANHELPSLLTEEDSLIICNYPESVLGPGQIFNKRLSKTPTRIFYYYKNGTDVPLEINVVVKNKGKSIEELTVVKGISGPSPDGLYAGHKAAKLFLENVLKQEMTTEELPMSQNRILLKQALKPGEISTGILWLSTKSSKSLELSFQIDDPKFKMLTPLISELSDPNFFIGTYPKSHRKLKIVFEPKDEIKEIAIGGKPFLKDKDTGLVLKGNYAVFHSLDLFLSNPSEKTEKLELLFSRVSGIARNVMIIDGVLEETAAYKSDSLGNPESLKYLTLKPHQKQRLKIHLFPQAGGFYPANLVIRRVALGEDYDT